MADKPADKLEVPSFQSLAEAQKSKGITRQEPAEQPAAAGKEAPLYVLGAERLKGAEFERIIYVATPGHGASIDSLMRPECWSAVAPKLRPWDHIEVRAEDGSYYAELLVLACDRAWAKVHILKYDALSTPDVSLTQIHSAYEIKHTPNLRWHIVRKSDRHIVKDSMQLRTDAEAALREHLRTVPS